MKSHFTQPIWAILVTDHIACPFFPGEVVFRFLSFVIAVLAGGAATTPSLQFTGNRLKLSVVVDRLSIASVKIQEENGWVISSLEHDQSGPFCTDRAATRPPAD